MKHPQLLNTQINDNDELILKLFIPKEIVFFNGHFPGNPILPGVVQVDWAIDFAAQFIGIKKENIGEISQLKFTKVILPDTTLFLSLKQEGHTLKFRYFNSQAAYSSGKLQVSD